MPDTTSPFRCYVCDSELTDKTASKEHVIPNACGGHWQSKELICRQCNSMFGDKCDAALAAQVNHCANLLGITRHRGEPQKLKGKLASTGEDYVLEASGRPMLAKPKIEEKDDNGQPTFSIVARDKKELRDILRGYLKKYPGTDIESLIKRANFTKEYLSEPIRFSVEIGGVEAFRSIAKIAINCYLLKGGDRKFIRHLIPYIQGQEASKVVWMHYPNPVPYIPNPEAITHIIKIIANPKEGILYAYIELFNVYNFLVTLNYNYTGPSLDITYIFDVFALIEKAECVPLDYSKEQVSNYINSTSDEEYIVNFRHRFAWLLGVAKARQDDKHMQKLIDQAWDEVTAMHPEGTQVNEDYIRSVSQIVADKLAPFLARQARSQLRDQA